MWLEFSVDEPGSFSLVDSRYLTKLQKFFRKRARRVSITMFLKNIFRTALDRALLAGEVSSERIYSQFREEVEGLNAAFPMETRLEKETRDDALHFMQVKIIDPLLAFATSTTGSQAIDSVTPGVWRANSKHVQSRSQLLDPEIQAKGDVVYGVDGERPNKKEGNAALFYHSSLVQEPPEGWAQSTLLKAQEVSREHMTDNFLEERLVSGGPDPLTVPGLVSGGPNPLTPDGTSPYREEPAHAGRPSAAHSLANRGALGTSRFGTITSAIHTDVLPVGVQGSTVVKDQPLAYDTPRKDELAKFELSPYEKRMRARFAMCPYPRAHKCRYLRLNRFSVCRKDFQCNS